MPSCNEPSCHCNQPTTVPCTFCDEPTRMTGTKLCDHCYEASKRLPRFISYPKGLAHVLSLLPQSAETKWDENADQDLECAGCGHPYHRHFDSYDDMRAVGCKYCDCHTLKFGS